MTTQPSAEVAADRARIKAITSLPGASSQLKAALAIALAGASLDEAKTVLQIAASAYSADEVAAMVNDRTRRMTGRR